jgi:hypothetical protein
MKKLAIIGGFTLYLVVWLGIHHSVASASPRQENTSFPFHPFTQTPVTAEEGERIARAYLSAHTAQYGLTPADLMDLQVVINFADADSGNRYVKFRQRIGDIEIYNALLNVTLQADGSVVYVGNRAIGNATQNINSRTAHIHHTEAIAFAARALQLSYDPATIIIEQTFDSADQKIRFAGGNLSYASIPVRLVYQPIADGTLRLAWNLDIYQRDGTHWWDIRVDALTGDILEKHDRVIYDYWGGDDKTLPSIPPIASLIPLNHLGNHNVFAAQIVTSAVPRVVGSYRVYGMPVESPNHSTPPAPADGRTLVTNPDHAIPSPFGWHDTNGVAGAEFTITQGNNAYAYTDIDANNLPDEGSSPDGGTSLIFDSPLDLTLHPSGYRPAAVTNLFYWANLLHDVSYLHGFTEEAGNFQENNYGNGGLASDSIHMQAQDGALTNNARYFHTPDGTNPSVEMFLWTPPTPDRDGDLDNGIILHEYGHGISLRLTGDGVSCLNNAEQMGEGWSDFQSVMLTQKVGDTATMPRGMGTYVINQPTTGPGVRVAPYTTDMAINNYTYGRLPELQGGSPLGFLWNTMLWDLNWKLIEVYGFNPDLHGAWNTGGNNLTYRLVHDGMKIQPCSPGFVDGRDSILAADEALTDGENECLIWETFARRGLGFSANQGSPNSTSDGTEAFDLPPHCIGVADIHVTPNAFEEVHTTPQTTTADMNLENTGVATLTWTITEAEGDSCSVPTDLSWLTVNPTNGSTVGSGSTSVTLTYNSSLLGNGVYSGTLCIQSNDPDETLIIVPVTLHVGPATAIELSRFTNPSQNNNYLVWGFIGLLCLTGMAVITNRK